MSREPKHNRYGGWMPPTEPQPVTDEDTKPDWDTPCELCGQVPTLPLTGMCGPCTFGEADTAGGNW